MTPIFERHFENKFSTFGNAEPLQDIICFATEIH